MRRITAIVISLTFFVTAVSAQSELTVAGISPDLYIVHKPVAKENYYSVGRLYNIAPREIATYNNLVFENGLQLGQAIKIPLTPNNFIQPQEVVNSGLAIPLYHIVEAKEGLYRVSVNYNKVPLEQLKKWNHLSSDAVSSGTKLIVGYLKVQLESPLAKNTGNIQKEVTVVPKPDLPAVKQNIDAPKEIITKINEPAKTADVVINTLPVTKEIPDAKSIPVTNITPNFSGGIFKKLYDDQRGSKTLITETGFSGVFKSTSGWQDGKYYCFHNNAPAGTIVKITNALNGKSVYAKVLDLIPDISQNAGLIVHLSNAAAKELGISSTRFECSLDYSK